MFSTTRNGPGTGSAGDLALPVPVARADIRRRASGTDRPSIGIWSICGSAIRRPTRSRAVFERMPAGAGSRLPGQAIEKGIDAVDDPPTPLAALFKALGHGSTPRRAESGAAPADKA